MGWDGMGWGGMGWDGMGWDGTEYKKCPSIFFILCGYIGYRNFNIFRGFQNLMSSWVVRIFFSK